MFTDIINNFQFDLQHVILLAGCVMVLYLAYRIGAFVLKVAIGVAVIGILVMGATRVWSYVAAHFI